MNHDTGKYCTLLIALTCFHVTLFAHENTTKKWNSVKSITGFPAATLVNSNNISAWYQNNGLAENDPLSDAGGVTYPRGTATAIYESGLIFGGYVHDGQLPSLRLNGQSYLNGMTPGRIFSPGIAASPADPDVRIYRIRSDYATADLRQDAAELFEKASQDVTQSDIDSVRHQYAIDWVEWPWQQGAPYYDDNGNGVKDSSEAPGIADATQVVWFVMNDLDSSRSASFLGSGPIGMELQVTLWAYQSSGSIAHAVYKRCRFLYKGTSGSSSDAKIDSMFVGQWSDPDLGDYSDDLVGCDTVLNLGFVYNGSSIDVDYRSFNLPPPAMGYDLLQGPVVPSPGDTATVNFKQVPGYRNLRMTSWIYFAAGGSFANPPFSYDGAAQWYRLMQGLTPLDGSPFVFPGDTVSTKYWLSGDPVASTGNNDGIIDPPSDRQMMLSCGPFTMALGDTQDFVLALVGGSGSSRLESISILKENDQAAQQVFDHLSSPVPVSVRNDWKTLPEACSLNQNFPNPFNPQTQISYTLPRAGYVKLTVYDVLGRAVKTLIDAPEAAGYQFVGFDGSNLASGVYFYQLTVYRDERHQAGDYTNIKKMLILR